MADAIGGERLAVFAAHPHCPRRDADDGGVGFDVFDDDGVAADARVIADFDGADDFGARAEDDVRADGGVAFARAPRGAAEGHALVDADVVAEVGGFADDDAHAVVNE